jgi:DNA-binding transcriptional LysR family regulator
MNFTRSIALRNSSVLDIEHLRSFLAIAETGSFTQAAERVNKTQSAVSIHIKRLEEQLDVRLFVKNGRGVRISSDGDRLIAHARRVLRAEADLISDLSAKGLDGRVIFGIPDDYALVFLADIADQLAASHPRLELIVQCYSTQELAERLRRGEVDVALVTDCKGIGPVEILREEPLHWVAGSRSGPVEFERPLPLALPAPSCSGRLEAIEALRAAEVSSKLLLSSSSYAAIKPIVQAGRAITVLPKSLVDRLTQRVVSTEAGLPELPNVQYGVIHGSPEPGAAVQALCEAVRTSVCGETIPRLPTN